MTGLDRFKRKIKKMKNKTTFTLGLAKLTAKLILGTAIILSFFAASPKIDQAEALVIITNTCTSTYQLAGQPEVLSGSDSAMVEVFGDTLPSSWITNALVKVTASSTEVIFSFGSDTSTTAYYLIRTNTSNGNTTVFGPVSVGSTYTDTTITADVIYNYAVYATLNTEAGPVSETIALGVSAQGSLFFDPSTSNSSTIQVASRQNTRAFISINNIASLFAGETEMMELMITAKDKTTVGIPAKNRIGVAQNVYEIYCRTMVTGRYLTSFATSIAMTLAYDNGRFFVEGTNVPVAQASTRLSVFRWTGSSWLRMPSTVDKAQQTLSSVSYHLSLFGICDMSRPGFTGYGAQPNPFTPNGDGINDKSYFKFPNNNIEEGMFTVFDLNGSVVYTEVITAGEDWKSWDGHYNFGKSDLVKAGIYIWQAKLSSNVYNGVVVVAR